MANTNALRHKRRDPWDDIHNFTPDEFDQKDLPGSGRENMCIQFIRLLDKARNIAGIPFIINSAFRTEQYNEDIGGKTDSSHITGNAADIDANNSRERFIIVDALIKVGLTRIGISDTKNGTFIHVDNDPNKVDKLIWIY